MLDAIGVDRFVARLEQDGAWISLEVLLSSPDASDRVHAREEAPIEMAAELGRRLAVDVLERGGSEILQALRDADAEGPASS